MNFGLFSNSDDQLSSFNTVLGGTSHTTLLHWARKPQNAGYICSRTQEMPANPQSVITPSVLFHGICVTVT